MAKTGSIKNIPLLGPLCLAKSKTDVEYSFVGYQENNAPVYGKTLSPLYKKVDAHHDYFTNEHWYDIQQNKIIKGLIGSDTGTTVFDEASGKYIKKEELNINCDSIAHYGDNLTWAKIKSSTKVNYVISTIDDEVHELDLEEKDSFAVRIIKVRSFCDSNNRIGFIVWYLGVYANGEEYNRYIYINGQTEVIGTAFSMEVSNPIINIMDCSNTVQFISFIGNAGVNRDQLLHRNIVMRNNVEHTDPKLSQTNIQFQTNKQVSVALNPRVTINYITRKVPVTFQGQSFYNVSVREEYEFNIDEPYAYPINFYIGAALFATIPAGNTTVTKTIQDGTYTETKTNWSNQFQDTAKLNVQGNMQSAYYLLLCSGGTITMSFESAIRKPTPQQILIGATEIRQETIVANLSDTGLFPFTVTKKREVKGSHIIEICDEADNVVSITGSLKSPQDNEKFVTGYRWDAIDVETGTVIESDIICTHNRFVSINIPTTNGKLPTGAFVAEGTYTGYNLATNTVTCKATAYWLINYLATNNSVPQYLKWTSINVNENYANVIFGLSVTDGGKIVTLETDSGADQMFINGGVLKGQHYNNYGSRVPYGGFNLCFNSGYISNISVSQDESKIGTIIEDWFQVSTDFTVSADADSCIYKTNSGKLIKVTKLNTSEEADFIYKVIEDRYIILNTDNYFNCYDIQTGTAKHYASDYNNRAIKGKAVDKISYDFDNDKWAKIIEGTEDVYLYCSSQNANYEQTQNYIAGLQIAPSILQTVYDESDYLISAEVPIGSSEDVDIYSAVGSESTTAIYQRSIVNGLSYYNTQLDKAVFPISVDGNIFFNPNLFSKIVQTYTNHDMIINNDIAYQLKYFNNTVPVLGYYMLNGTEGVTNSWVLQTQAYGCNDKKIYAMSYSNGVLQSCEAIADIKGLDYLGATPQKAMFWNKMNRTFYMFSGTALLEEMEQANDIDEIYGTWYCPSAAQLFIATNVGLLCVSDLGEFKLNDITEVENIFFLKDRFIVNILGEESESIFYAYNIEEGYESNKVRFITKYYGFNDTPMSVNNIYIRLYNQSVADAEGEITFKVYTLTDIGCETDVKTIQIKEGKSEWDAQTESMLIKYTPKYTWGKGVSLEINSDFPIVSIDWDIVKGAGEYQNSHINI